MDKSQLAKTLGICNGDMAKFLAIIVRNWDGPLPARVETLAHNILKIHAKKFAK